MRDKSLQPSAAAGGSSPRPPDPVELRRLWESGRRGPALRQALDNWEWLLAHCDDLHWLQAALRTSGLKAEAFALQAAIARRRTSAQEWEAVVRSVLHSGDPWWARELLQEAGVRSRELEKLRIEIELALRGDPSPFIAAWTQAHRDEAALDLAVEWWVRAGRVEEAERLVEEVGLRLWQARLAVWRNQPQAARAALENLPQSPATRCLHAVAAVLEGRLEDAEAQLRELLDGEARAEAWSWLTTVLRRQGRYAEAQKAADSAAFESPDFNLVLRLERELAAEYEHFEPSSAAPRSLFKWLFKSRRSSPQHRTVKELEHAWAVYPFGLRPEDPITALEGVIERFGGNHTAYPTLVERGKLAFCALPAEPGQLGASIQLVQQTRGADAARALYREYAERFDHHPRILLYLGELELWMGAYEEGARLFREILSRNREMKWAWIGLGASAMLQGDLQEAQKVWKEGLAVTRRAGPTLYVYRGECFRRQGELDAARRDLELAVSQKPQRLSARINLALVDRRDEVLQEVERTCAEYAPLLMEAVDGTRAERLEKVLDAMRGNRSSTRATYHLWDRVWHVGLAGS